MVWRAARCLRPCDRLSSPVSVILRQLKIIRNKMTNSYYYGLHIEVESEKIKSCKMPETL